MKLISKIALFILLINPHYGNSQESSSDTVCLSVDTYKNVLKFAYRGKAADSLITTYDSTIITLEKIIIEKNDQIQLSEGVINGLANEVKRLKTINILLGISTGALIIGLLALLL